MAKTNVGKMSTNPAFTQYKEMHLFNPHRNSTGTYHTQGRYQSQICKNKIILDLKPPVNPKQVKVLLGHMGYY